MKTNLRILIKTFYMAKMIVFFFAMFLFSLTEEERA